METVHLITALNKEYKDCIVQKCLGILLHKVQLIMEFCKFI
jgi:hypothetical protein